MSVRDNEKVIQLIDGQTGNIIDVIKRELYHKDTVIEMITDIVIDNVILNDRGLQIRVGYKS